MDVIDEVENDLINEVTPVDNEEVNISDLI